MSGGSRRPIRRGRSGGRRTRPRPTGTRPLTSSAWSPPTSPTTRTAARCAACASWSPSSAACPARPRGRRSSSETGLARAPLTALANGRDLDHAAVAAPARGDAAPLASPSSPKRSASSAATHFEARFAAYGAEPESFDYRVVKDTTDGVPSILEAAFAWLPQLGIAACSSPGSTGRPASSTRSASSAGTARASTPSSAEQRAGQDEPVVLVTHLACPRVEYTDRGKSAVAAQRGPGATRSSAPSRPSRRSGRSSARPRSATPRPWPTGANVMTPPPDDHRSATPPSASWRAAYRKVSDNGKLPALARQIMYAARPTIQRAVAPRELGDKFDKYFTQAAAAGLRRRIPADHRRLERRVRRPRAASLSLTLSKRVPLGTLKVRDYLAEIRGHAVDRARFRHLGTALPDDRASQPFRRDSVRRERRLRPALRGGEAR